jgi:ribosomal protein L13
MTQFSSVEEYNRDAETQKRLKQNRKIDAIVEKSLKGMLCDCGSGDVKQKKRGTYIVVCKSCTEEYKLID